MYSEAKQWCETKCHTHRSFLVRTFLGPQGCFSTNDYHAHLQDVRLVFLPTNLSKGTNPLSTTILLFQKSQPPLLISLFLFLSYSYSGIRSVTQTRSNVRSKHGNHYCFFREVFSELFAKPTNKKRFRVTFRQRRRRRWVFKLRWDTG